MNQKTLQAGLAPIALIGIVIAILLVGAAGWYFISGRSTTPSGSTETPETESREQVAEPTGEISDTMEALIGRGQSLECDWKMPNMPEGAAMSNGKLWTTGNKGRSQVSGNVSGMSMEANAIFKDNTVYSWVMFGGQKMGFKMNPEELSDANNSMSAEQKQQAEQIRSQMIFNCQAWTPDESKFALPSDIIFR